MAAPTVQIVNINQLNDHCFEAIFRILPLQTLVRARIVCKKWKVLIETYICSRQKSLMLFNSFHDILRYGYFKKDYNGEEESDLRYSEDKDLIMPGGLTRDKCDFLIRLFPNVKVLVLFYTKFDSSDTLVNLLTNWSDTLESLSMIHMHRSYDLAQFFVSINSRQFPALKRLCVAGDAKYLLKTSIKMPKIISGIEELSLGQYACSIAPVLQSVGPNMRKIRLCKLKFPLKTLERLVFSKPYLKNRLTHLSINREAIDFGLSQKTLKFICSNFKALTYLDITTASEDNLVDIVPILSGLKHLTDLRLRLPYDRQYLTTIKKAQLELAHAPLDSVKNLHLYHDLKHKHIPLLARLLPNVEHLVFQDDLRCECKLNQYCDKCTKKKMLKELLYRRFNHLKSVKFELFNYKDFKNSIRSGRFAKEFSEIEEMQPNRKEPDNDDDIYSAMWADPYFDDPNEDNGYDQTIVDQKYNFHNDYFYEEGERPSSGFWTSSRSPGWHNDDDDEQLNFIKQYMSDNPQIPHFNVKF